MAIESHIENLLSRTILGTKYLWVSLKAMPEIRTWVWVVYLDSDPTKHEHPGKKNGMVKAAWERPTLFTPAINLTFWPPA